MPARRFPPPQYDFSSRDIRLMSVDKHATQSRSCLIALSGWATLRSFFCAVLQPTFAM
jgi:hypothetical protein